LEKPHTYPALKTHLGGRINMDLIRDNWDELLRMAASMNERIVAPSAILKNSPHPRSPANWREPCVKSAASNEPDS
jgi:TnpA family transposase